MIHKSLCFTGHRKVPGRGYGEWQGIPEIVSAVILSSYQKGFRNYYCGGAIGFDTIAAYAVIAAKKVYPDIKLIMVIPFKNQPCKWPPDPQAKYNETLAQADSVIFVDKECGLTDIGNYSAAKMFLRNEYMVNKCNAVVACISNTATSGSKHCILYAKSKNKPILTINPDTLEKTWDL